MKKPLQKRQRTAFRLPFSKRLSTQFLFFFIVMTVLITAISSTFLYSVILRSAEHVRQGLAKEVGSSLSSTFDYTALRDISTMSDYDPDIFSMDFQETENYNELERFRFYKKMSGCLSYEQFSTSVQRQLDNSFTSAVCLFYCPENNPSNTYVGLFNQYLPESVMKPEAFSFHQKGTLNEQFQQILKNLEASPKINLSVEDYIKKEDLDLSEDASSSENDVRQLYRYISSPDYMIQKMYIHKYSSGLTSSTLVCAIKLETSLEDAGANMFYLETPPKGLDEETRIFYQKEIPFHYYMLVEIPVTTKAQILFMLCTLFGILLFFMLLLHFLLRQKILSPLEQITSHMNCYVEKTDGLFTPLKEQPVKNELSLVNNSLLKMEDDIQDYIENLAQTTKSKNVMRAEFDVARQIQQNLFPCHFPAFPERQDFDVFVTQSSSNCCGGDFYNFSLLDPDHLLLYIGTTSGSGIPTSMFSVIAFTLLQSFSSRNSSPKQILEVTNNSLSQNNNASLSVDVFLGIIDLGNGILTYAAAGSPKLYIKHSGSSFEEIPPQNCFPLGNIERVHYTNNTINFSQSDLLFAPTKGASEAVNAQGMRFGSDYVLSSLNELVSHQYLLSDMGKALEKQIAEFTKKTPQTFDRTLLLFRYLGK